MVAVVNIEDQRLVCLRGWIDCGGEGAGWVDAVDCRALALAVWEWGSVVICSCLGEPGYSKRVYGEMRVVFGEVYEVLHEISPDSYPAMISLASPASSLAAPREASQSTTHRVVVHRQPAPPRGYHVAFLVFHRVASHKLHQVAWRPHEVPLAIPPYGTFPNVSLAPHSASRHAYPLVSLLTSPFASSPARPPAAPAAHYELCHDRAPAASQAVFRAAHCVSRAAE